MYFATYQMNEESTVNVGIVNVEKTRIVSLKDLYVRFQKSENLGKYPKDMQSLIELSDEDLIRKLFALCQREELYSSTVALEDVKLYAPIPYPRRNVFCVGKNYLDHVQEIRTAFGDIPKYPVFFSKVAYPAIGDKDIIDSHLGIVEELDYEVELAVVIGKEGKNIPKEKAEEYIFGYTILNDVTARDLQKKHSQWHKGKSLDTFCPMGPFLVYKDALPSPLNLDICCKVNGEVRQDSNTKHLIFDVSTLIHILSKGITLRPGDVIATGTPSGVGMGFDPPRYLKAGDTVICAIEKIGTLTNVVK
jgi:2-keto-4-pentenoate hydratase/2-oxohepta-3-ene-1,7-dioic acid hydratase in catechol pathway